VSVAELACWVVRYEVSTSDVTVSCSKSPVLAWVLQGYRTEW